MRVLDLFSGSGSFSQAFKDRGHEVTTVDIEPRFKPDIPMDIMDMDGVVFAGRVDAVISAPPCTALSVASIGTHWKGGIGAYIPATEEAKHAIRLVTWTQYLIDRWGSRFDVMENPRDVLRNLWFMRQIPRKTVWYCQYGDERAKPTDLFGRLPPSFVPKTCHNGNKDHAAAPRGAKTGTQGRKGAYERSKVPYNLSLELCLAMERDIRP